MNIFDLFWVYVYFSFTLRGRQINLPSRYINKLADISLLLSVLQCTVCRPINSKILQYRRVILRFDVSWRQFLKIVSSVCSSVRIILIIRGLFQLFVYILWKKNDFSLCFMIFLNSQISDICLRNPVLVGKISYDYTIHETTQHYIKKAVTSIYTNS